MTHTTTNVLAALLVLGGYCAFSAVSQATPTERGGEGKASPAADSGEFVLARGGGGRGGGGGMRGGGGGGGGRAMRGGASSSINHGVNRGGGVNRGVDRNVNRNTNRNVNRNVNVSGNWNGGYGGDWDDRYHPVATGAAIAATAAVVGSMVNTVPANCGTVVVDGISYQQCGDSWYQPQYSGTLVQYEVVGPPQ